jgi:hypothetical protein
MGKILGCVGCIGCLGVVIIAGIIAAAAVGLLPAVANLLQFDTPRDLGIKYSVEESVAAHKKAGNVQMIELPTDTAFARSYRVEGSRPAKFTMDSRELSAHLSNRPWKYWPLEHVQVRINPDGSVEGSAVVNAEKLLAYTEAIGFKTEDVKAAMNQYHIPFRNLAAYAKGAGSVKDNKVNMTIDSVTVGPIPIPGSVIADNTSRVIDVIETALSRIPSVQIQSLVFEDGVAKFDGTTPEKEYVVMK